MKPTVLITNFLLVTAAMLFPLCASVEKGNIYHIRNLADNGYLQVESGGALCKHMGPVGTTISLNATLPAYRWRYSELVESLRWLDIESNGDMLQDNELTMEPIKPYCYPTYRNINIIPVSQNVYRVQNVVDERCMLVSNGVGSRISWAGCDENNLGQQWEFIEA